MQLQQEVGQREVPKVISAELQLEAVGGARQWRCHDASIVERRVESAKFANRPVHHRRHLCVVTDITTHRKRLVTSSEQLLRFRLHGVFFEVCQHYGRARFCERLCRCEAHASGSPGDERHFASEVQWIVHNEFLSQLFTSRVMSLPYFKCSVKKEVSLSHGIRFTRS